MTPAPLANPSSRNAILVAAASAFTIGVVVLAVLFWPKPRPDFEIAELDSVLDFALLEEDFNELPVQERVDLVSTLIQRFRSMEAGDSVMMAAFAASIRGAAREQLERNAFRLAIDLFDLHAAAYPDIPPDERAAYLDRTLVEFIRTTSLLGGEIDERSDDEIISDAKEQAQRDRDRFRERGVTADQAGGIFSFLNTRVGARTNPHERARLGLYVRDLTRHLRGQPLDGPAPRR